MNRNIVIPRVVGLFIAILTVFLIISCVSYLFHWQEDMSILSNIWSADPYAVGNAGRRLGALTGNFLFCDGFGFAIFILLAIPVLLSIRLFSNSGTAVFLKKTLIILCGGIIAAMALSFIGNISGNACSFGGGWGGRCGNWIVTSLENLIGPVAAGLVILLLILCYLFIVSRSFTNWFAGLFTAKKAEIGPEQEPELEVEIEPEPLPEPEPEIEIESEPLPEPEPVVPEGNFEILDQGESLQTEVTEELKPIDNRMDPPEGLPKYKFPSLDLLDNYDTSRKDVGSDELARNNNKIRSVLGNYKIQINDVKALVGPTVTLYKVYPAPGVKIAEIKKLQEDIQISLGANGVRVVALKDSVGIEVANEHPGMVPLKALLNSEAFHKTKADLPVAIGYTITREVKVFDLADAPHLLVAGATKQGKSVGLNVIVSSLLYHRHPSELKFVFIDPKMVEFSAYSDLLHHYLAVLPDAGDEFEEKNKAIVKNPKDAEKVLRSLCLEMDERYELLSKANVNNIKLYNDKFKQRRLRPDKGHRFLPYLVAVVDEYADLTMMTGASPEARTASKSITNSIIRLAQKGRAAGLHVILATQRPSVDVISGVIKSNFPMRIAFRVASRTDSQTILDSPGAEKLIGKGDMLFCAGIESERIQCGYVSGDEIAKVTDFIGSQSGYGKSYNTPYYLPMPAEATGEAGGSTIDMTDVDERFEEAANNVVQSQRASTSDLQRKLGMGYAKAGRVMDQLEAAGIVGPQEGSKPRQVLIPDFETLEPILRAYRK